jgi:RNA polymerase sigma factor (TIGR02999 family)
LESRQLTGLLTDWQEQPEDPKVAEALARQVYNDLHTMARRRVNGNDHLPISPTELVSEAWLRLESSDRGFNDRYHFFRLASLCMRQLLVDLARQGLAAKRGAEYRQVTLKQVGFDNEQIKPEVLDLDRALKRLSQSHARPAEVALLHCFGGLGLVEAGELLGISRATVKRDWQFARAWLLAELQGYNDE